MKEFVVYTVLRIVLFLASFGVVVGIMALAFDGRYNLFWAVILAFLISGIGVLLHPRPPARGLRPAGGDARRQGGGRLRGAQGPRGRTEGSG